MPSSSLSTRALELLFMDVWGTFPIVSIASFRYYLLIVDVFTRFSWFFPLHNKSQVFNFFVQFKTMVRTMFSTKIMSIKTIEVKEFMNREFHVLFHKFGITNRHSCLYTPMKMGSIERKYRHVVETVLALLASSSVPKIYRDKTFQTVVYFINRLPTLVLNKKSPYEKLTGHIPNYSFLKVFGCSCYLYLSSWTKYKLEYFF